MNDFGLKNLIEVADETTTVGRVRVRSHEAQPQEERTAAKTGHHLLLTERPHGGDNV